MLFGLGCSGLRIRALKVFFSRRMAAVAVSCVCQCACARVCVCVDTSTKLIISDKRSIKFLAFKALCSLESHAGNFVSCVLVVVFQVLFFLISSHFKMTDLQATESKTAHDCCSSYCEACQNYYKMLEVCASPDLMTCTPTVVHRLCMDVSLKWSNIPTPSCLNVSPVITNVQMRKEWLIFYMVHSTVCSD